METNIKRCSNCRKICDSSKEDERKVSRNIEYYNLDMILSVGYRINAQVVCWQKIKALKNTGFQDGIIKFDARKWLFNHEDIKEVIFRGYEDEERTKFLNELSNQYEKE